jgi:hypothetical protein
MMVAPGVRWGIAFLQSQNEAYRFVVITWSNLLAADVGDPAHLSHLVCRVVDQNVDAAKFVYGGVDDALAGGLVADVAGTTNGLATGGFDQPYGFVCVGLLRLQVTEHHVRTLPGEGQGHGAADAGVCSGDHGPLVGETVAAAVGLFAVIRLVLHRLSQARMRLLLVGVLWLFILGGGVGLLGLVCLLAHVPVLPAAVGGQSKRSPRAVVGGRLNRENSPQGLCVGDPAGRRADPHQR